MGLKLPKVIGHRGACGYAPENTLVSIHTAADMGIQWVEFDVKLTRDGIPILFHDDMLDRTTNGSGLVAETDYDDIRQMEAGSWFGESFAGVGIPTLEEALEVVIDRGLGLNMEIKPCPGREKETAEVALDILSHVWDEHDRLLISSFKPVCVEAARDMANDWARGMLFKPTEENPDPLENWKDVVDYLDVKTVNLRADLVTQEISNEIADLGLSLLVFTVNDEEQAEEFFRMGVDCIVSDVPDVILDVVPEAH
jgi:glycerophosphoryl diester phosphodiesterase